MINKWRVLMFNQILITNFKRVVWQLVMRVEMLIWILIEYFCIMIRGVVCPWCRFKDLHVTCRDISSRTHLQLTM